jgi:hypothetical protein
MDMLKYLQFIKKEEHQASKRLPIDQDRCLSGKEEPMKTPLWSFVFKAFMILTMLTAATGCNLPDLKVGVDDPTREVLEDAIDELGNWPGEWETTLNSVVDELGEVGSDLASDIRREVESLMRATIQTAQEASFCEVDFIGIRTKQHMQAILHSFFPEDSDPAVYTPIICTVNPTIVQSDSIGQVEYSGFDFLYFYETGTFSADLVYGDNGEVIKANFGTVNVTTNYHFTVDIQGYDYTPIDASRHPSLVVKWNSDTIEGQSAVPINIVPAVAPPPTTTTVYILNYMAFNEILAGGPNRGNGNARVDCPEGSIVTGLVGKKGEYITTIGLMCSPLNSDGSTGTRTTFDLWGTYGPHAWSGVECPTNSGLYGINGVYGGYVDRIQGVCRFITHEEDSEYTGWAGEGGTDEDEKTCSEGHYVTGIRIKWGNYIDGLTLICTQVIQVSPTATPLTSTSDFHVAPTATPASSSIFHVAPTSTP